MKPILGQLESKFTSCASQNPPLNLKILCRTVNVVELFFLIGLEN